MTNPDDALTAIHEMATDLERDAENAAVVFVDALMPPETPAPEEEA